MAMNRMPIPLSVRLEEYEVAEHEAASAAAKWLEVRAGGRARMTTETEGALDNALGALKRAKRRLERTQKLGNRE